MNQPINLKNHFCLTSHNEVRQICAPLFKHLNTTYFNFVRRYTDGSECCLTTDSMWTEFFYTERLYQRVFSDRHARSQSLIHRVKHIPWTQFLNSPVRLAQSKYFNTGIGSTIIFTRSNYADFFYFGTQNENTHMEERYENFPEPLIQFAHYFYDKGKKLIEKSTEKNNRLILPDRVIHKYESAPKDNTFNLEKFINESKPKKFMLYTERAKEVYLSQAEIACLSMLTSAKTASEMGEVSCKSRRTIEKHIENIKIKLLMPKGTTKADLVSEVLKSGFELHELQLENN